MTQKLITASVLSTVAITGVATALHAENLVVSNWDGYMAADAIDSYSAETGNGAELVLHGTNEEIMGKLIASKGKGYDVVFVSSPFAEVLNNLGLAETLDHAKLPNIQQFPITFKLSGPAPNLGVRHGSVVAGARWGHSNTIQAAAWLVKLR